LLTALSALRTAGFPSKSVGVRADVFLPGFVNAGFDTDGAGLFYGLRFYNTSEWENHRVPVLENIYGAYPSSPDEIMVPSWVLERWDITKPYIGMELPFSYQSGSMQEAEQKSFRLSGWFNEYDYIGDGNIAYLLVSEAFCHEIKFDIWSNQETTANMHFSNTQSIAEVTSSIESSLKLSSGQTLSVNPDLLSRSTNFQTIAVCIILGLGIVLCGYLFRIK